MFIGDIVVVPAPHDVSNDKLIICFHVRIKTKTPMPANRIASTGANAMVEEKTNIRANRLIYRVMLPDCLAYVKNNLTGVNVWDKKITGGIAPGYYRTNKIGLRQVLARNHSVGST